MMATTSQLAIPTVPVPLNLPAKTLASALPTPIHGPGGSFTIASSTTISAPLSTVVAILLTSSTYPSWNRYIRKVVGLKLPMAPTPPPAGLPSGIDILPGVDMVFHAHLDPDSDVLTAKSKVHVYGIDTLDLGGRKGWQVRWGAVDMPGFMLRSERIQEIWEDGKGGTEYYQWETFYGLLGSVVKWNNSEGMLKGIQAMMVGLKGEAEKRQGQS